MIYNSEKLRKKTRNQLKKTNWSPFWKLLKVCQKLAYVKEQKQTKEAIILAQVWESPATSSNLTPKSIYLASALLDLIKGEKQLETKDLKTGLKFWRIKTSLDAVGFHKRRNGLDIYKRWKKFHRWNGLHV